jgi:hypothetical protein
MAAVAGEGERGGGGGGGGRRGRLRRDGRRDGVAGQNQDVWTPTLFP